MRAGSLEPALRFRERQGLARPVFPLPCSQPTIKILPSDKGLHQSRPFPREAQPERMPLLAICLDRISCPSLPELKDLVVRDVPPTIGHRGSCTQSVMVLPENLARRPDPEIFGTSSSSLDQASEPIKMARGRLHGRTVNGSNRYVDHRSQVVNSFAPPMFLRLQ